MCEVVNINSKYDVYVGRSNNEELHPQGNPYSHKENTLAKFKTNTIEEALIKYEEYLINNKNLMDNLHLLKYKKIACFCKTKKCHAYILKKYVDILEQQDKIKTLF